jgi:hypothetical protein
LGCYSIFVTPSCKIDVQPRFLKGICTANWAQKHVTI